MPNSRREEEPPPNRVREELPRRCREERIEPPAAARITRMVRSALHNAEERWFDTIAARCGLAASARIVALIGGDADPTAEDAGENADPDSVLALIKSVPGNVSLESMLTEIRKLTAIRAVGLPPGLFADAAPKVMSGWRGAGRGRVAVAVAAAAAELAAVGGDPARRCWPNGNGRSPTAWSTY